jgi:hypothetical protein
VSSAPSALAFANDNEVGFEILLCLEIHKFLSTPDFHLSQNSVLNVYDNGLLVSENFVLANFFLQFFEVLHFLLSLFNINVVLHFQQLFEHHLAPYYKDALV